MKLTAARVRTCPVCPAPYTDTPLGRMAWHLGTTTQLNGKPQMCSGTGYPPVYR